MARPLRVEFAGACYHVINRGNLRFPIFREERDRELLLAKLVGFAERYGVGIRAYCIQTNHFHVYIQTGEANLGRFMQSFLTSFAVSYNRRHGTAGHVFQGRYKAFLVDEDGPYGSRVSRYIHLNPVRIASLEGAPVQELQRELRECHWSSYSAVIGLQQCPEWLAREDVLRNLGATLREQQAAYATYVEQGLTKDIWDPWEAAAAQAIIGSDDFVDRIRRGLAGLPENLNARSESTQRRNLLAWQTLGDVQATVAKAYGCPEEHLLCRHSRDNEARQILLYLVATHCRGRRSLSDLGQDLGPITVGALSRARSLMAARIGKSQELKARVLAIEATLSEDASMANPDAEVTDPPHHRQR